MSSFFISSWLCIADNQFLKISICIIFTLQYFSRKVFARVVGNVSQAWLQPQNPSLPKLEYLCYTRRVAVIRSSDIGNYLYCRRAWWYKKQGLVSENQAELAGGTELHRQHGRQVLSVALTRTLGLILLMLALILLIAYCTSQIL